MVNLSQTEFIAPASKDEEGPIAILSIVHPLLRTRNKEYQKKCLYEEVYPS
jgi:hypothetical protein